MVITQPSHLNTRPFANRTTFDHMKTGLVWFSDGYCISGLEFLFTQKFKINQQFKTTEKPFTLKTGPSEMQKKIMVLVSG